MAFGWDDALGFGFGIASTLPQWFTGNNQERLADQLSASLVRPTFNIPESELKSLQSAETQAGLTRLPGQSAIEGRLDQTTANTIASIERLGIGGPTTLNAASRAYGKQMDQENQLGIESANMRLRNQDVLRNELDENADWQQKEWDWNQRMPYEQKAVAIQALREGSMRNKNSALENIFGMGANLFGGMGGGDNNFNWQDVFKSTSTGNNFVENSKVEPRTTDPNSPLFKRDFGRKPLFESFNLGGMR